MADIQARMKIRRGTDAEIAAALVEEYELLYATDTHKLYISTGLLEPKYELASPSDFEDLLEFMASKAAASGLASLDSSSKVVQNPANATATPTASKIPIADESGKLDGWVTDIIDDGTTDSSSTWSSSMIRGAIDASIFGIGEFIDSVLDKLAAPPVAPTDGDRYMIIATASGAWTGKEAQVAQYVTDAWDYTIPTEGTCCYVDDEDLLYVFNGTTWVPINNYALASSEPPSVSSSTSGATGDATTVARSNHSHDLGTHTHADNTAGGTISHTALTDKGTTTHADIDSQIPSADEKDALYGTEGDADADNPYMTLLDFMEAFGFEIDGDLVELDYTPTNYTSTVAPETSSTIHLTSHLKGIDLALASILSRLDAHSI